MSEPNPRFWEIFFELYEGLPRQGPGNRRCAERAIELCRDLPPSPSVLDLDYPTMGRVPDVLTTIGQTGFSLVDHFTLPDEAWWDDFYTPMERRKYAGDAEALAALDQFAQEPGMHRRYSGYYADELFVARRK